MCTFLTILTSAILERGELRSITWSAGAVSLFSYIQILGQVFSVFVHDGNKLLLDLEKMNLTDLLKPQAHLLE